MQYIEVEKGYVMSFKKCFFFFIKLTILTIFSSANSCPKWFPLSSIDSLVVIMPIYDERVTGADMDCDGILDNVDPDIDGDDISNVEENAIGTNPRNPDSDGDGVNDNDDFFPLDASESLQKITISTDSSGDYFCDGIDDDEQINQALREVSLTGGIVHLKAGTYKISNQIVIEQNNTTLEGEGKEITIIQLKDEADWGEYNITSDTYGNAAPLIVNTNAARVNLTFKNFTLDGNKYNQHYQVAGVDRQVNDGHDNYHGFKILGTDFNHIVNHVHFSHMKIKNTADDGILTIYVKDVEVDDVVFEHIGHSGVYMIYTDGVIVKNSEFLVTVNSGVRFDSSNHILVQNNHIYGEIEKTGNSNFGIQITVRDADDMPFNHVILEKNIISHTAGAGICIDAEDPSNTSNLKIQNNVIYQCGNVGTEESRKETGGINLKNLKGTTIINNTLVNNIGGAIRIGGNVGFYTDVPVETTIERNTLIKNNIIIDTVKENDNLANGYGIDIKNTEVNKVTCSYNNFWNNISGNTIGCENENDSLLVNPNFVSSQYGTGFLTTNDSNFNLHLKKGSPAVDAGDPIIPVMNEPNPNGGIINLGAYGGTIEATVSQ